jgi:hypothetical protein
VSIRVRKAYIKSEGGKHKLLANLFPYGRPVLSILSHVDSSSQIGPSKCYMADTIIRLRSPLSSRTGRILSFIVVG